MLTSDFDTVIETCLNADLPLSLSRHGFNAVRIEVGGFYKSGHVTLYKDKNGDWIAEDRYGKCTPINDFSDLVDLNFQWWEMSRKRCVHSWTVPDENWKALLVKYGYIQVIPAEQVVIL